MAKTAQPPKTKEQRKRKRRLLRTLLLKFLKRLRKACEYIETPAQWYDVTQELRGIIWGSRGVMTSTEIDGLWLATQLTDQTATGITQACTILQSQLVSVIASLPAGGIGAPVLLAGALVVAVVVAAVAIYLNATSVSVTIQNINCERIAVIGLVPISIPGMDLPAFVPTNTTADAQLPPIAFNTGFIPPNGIQATIFGAPLVFGLPTRVSSATFDGVNLMQGTHTFNLASQPSHALVIQCN